jgi:type I restriction enzyme S subunit
MSDDLPQGWAVTRLEEIAEVNPRHPGGLADDLPVSFISMTAISESSWRFLRMDQRAYGEVRKGYTHFAEGDVLFAKITPCMENGKAAIATGLKNQLGCGTTEVHVLRPHDGVEARYLYHLIHQDLFRREAVLSFTGTAGQLRVPVSFLREYELRLPPRLEQRRIVEKLEQLLGKADNCEKRLEAIPITLRRFRQSILNAASRGRLTADWRLRNQPNESASAFVHRIQQERKAAQESAKGGRRKPKTVRNESEVIADYEPDEIPDSWCVAPISDITDCLDNLRVPVNKTVRSTRSGTVPYYGANGQVGWIDKFLFDEDLVLIVEDETFIGREKPFSYVIRGKTWVNNHAHVLRPSGGMHVDYLNISLSYYDFTPLTSGTTGRRKLNQEALLSAPLMIAPLLEQQEIVRRVEALFTLADNIEARYGKAKAYVDKLTQSVLSKAMRGELVPTEAEVAGAEGRNFESAEDLLTSIRHDHRTEPRSEKLAKRNSGKTRGRH